MSTTRDRHGQPARHVDRAAFWKNYRIMRGALKTDADPAECLCFLRAFRTWGAIGAGLYAAAKVSEVLSKESR